MDDGKKKKEVEPVPEKVCFVGNNITAHASSPYSHGGGV